MDRTEDMQSDADTAVKMTVADARSMLNAATAGLGYPVGVAERIADHLLDSELRGLAYGGFARLVSIAERLAGNQHPPFEIRVRDEGAAWAALDGCDVLGYIVGQAATDLALTKVAVEGTATVTADRTYYSGMLSYYAEQFTRRGFVVFIATNTHACVAPYGALEGRFGTNPVCVGFPSSDGRDVIWDISTSATAHAEVMLARRVGRPLPPGVAIDRAGEPTLDPAAALDGAFTAWGGPRGSGLGLVVQLLGMMAGSPTAPGVLADAGFMLTAWNPRLFRPDGALPDMVADYSDWVRSAAAEPGAVVRMPFDRSRQLREATLAADVLSVEKPLYDTVTRMARRATRSTIG